MRKKNNPYKNLDLTQVKEELHKNVGYLADIDIESLNDDIIMVTDARGLPQPQIVATIEQKVTSYILTIKECLEQLHVMMKLQQEVTPDMGLLLDQLEERMVDIETYFKKRDPKDIKDRIHEIQMISKKNVPYTIKRVAANEPTQHNFRNKTRRIIIDLLPIINDLREGRKDPKLLRGDADLPHSLIDYLEDI